LQGDWERFDFVGPMRRSLEMERAMGGMTLQHYREKGGIFDLFTVGTTPAPATISGKVVAKAKQLVSPTQIRKNSSEMLWQSALSYEDEMLALQGMQVLVETCREMATNGCYAHALSNAESRLENILPPESGELEFSWLGTEDYSLADIREMFSSAAATMNALKKVQSVEAFRALVVTAIALKRFELAYGEYPTALESLVPAYLSAVPVDPVDGLPLRYRRKSTGTFLLYSIGQDSVDDGGDASRPERNGSRSSSVVLGRDWVWPRPASPEEIQAWADDESKRVESTQ